ncbi:hypothetical protein DFJ63DRAFT_311772 [Scheffersomyces coipomensis]|uniref:uncharacterized protein n=1 Tax=Scheffersomyces coipomensis TaxID=1788519 RepID=UPI00315C9787
MSYSNTLGSESSSSTSRTLTQQLDDIANEASFYTPLEEPISDSPINSYDGTNSTDLNPINNIVNNDGADNEEEGSSYFVPHIIKKFLPGTSSNSSNCERQPLLPISRQDCQPTRKDTPQCPTPPPPPPAASLLTSILAFIWNNVFTEPIRQFLINHRTWVLLIGLLVLIAVGLILYLTGNLAILIVYIRILLCYVFGGSSPTYCNN